MHGSRISLREPVSERTPRPLAGTLLAFDLERELDSLMQESVWATNGHNARTLVKHEVLRVVLIALARGQRMREHAIYHQLMLQVLSGRLRVVTPEGSLELSAGHILALDRMVSHDVEALEESSLLLTVGSSEN